ncbi:unnamed protein product [Polarella glacialis]|uniref:Ubiquitin-like domain-containing protein n=1 Tax=Polarella glacialis TaxID=89957 RepID=A0A813IS16_POLGL|nr:unnamed protein product [Polarella glacialis]
MGAPLYGVVIRQPMATSSQALTRPMTASPLSRSSSSLRNTGSVKGVAHKTEVCPTPMTPVIRRPQSAPFQRAPQPTPLGNRRPLWRPAPASPASPVLQTTPSFSSGNILRAASQEGASSEEEGEAGRNGTAKAAQIQPGGARPWHVPDGQIEELVRTMKEDAAPSSSSDWSRRVVSPSSANRAVYMVPGRVRRPFAHEACGDHSGPNSWTASELGAAMKEAADSPVVQREEDAKQPLDTTMPPSNGVRWTHAGSEEQEQEQAKEAERRTREDKAKETEDEKHVLNFFKRFPEASSGPILPNSADMSAAASNSKRLHRCASTPAARRVASAGGSAASGTRLSAHELVDLTVRFVDNSHTILLRLDPDLRIGSDAPPHGQVRPDWKPGWAESLKGVIEEISGIPVSSQVLFCHKCKMGIDRYTLRSYNATLNGTEIQVRLQRGISFSREGVLPMQSCTLKWQRQQKKRAEFADRQKAISQGDARRHAMPKWQPPMSSPYFEFARRGTEGVFAYSEGEPPVRVQLYGDPFMRFADCHTWRPDEGKQEWDRIRNGQTYTQALQFV